MLHLSVSTAQMKRLFRHNLTRLAGGLILLIASHFLFQSTLLNEDPMAELGRFETVLHEKEDRLSELLEEMALDPNRDWWQEMEANPTRFTSLFANEGMILLHYRNDTLVFWSDNSVQVDGIRNPSSFHSRLVRMPNGWYEAVIREKGKHAFVGLLLLKTVYPYQNNYLINAFQADYRFPAESELGVKSIDRFNIRTGDGEPLCSVIFPSDEEDPLRQRWPLLLLDILGLILVWLSLHAYFDRLAKRWRPNVVMLLYGAVLVGLRALTIEFGLPQSIYHLTMFGPEQYATSDWFPSLGDLLVNVSLLFYLAYLFNSRVSIPVKAIQSLSRLLRIALGVMLMVVVFGFALVCDDLIEGLISDSSITFDVNNLFSLDWYSYNGIFAMGVLLFTYFLIIDKALTIVRGLGLRWQGELIILLVAFGLFVVYSLFTYYFQWMLVFWPLVVVAISMSLKWRNKPGYSFEWVILLLIVFSAFGAATLSDYVRSREHRERQLQAEKLSDDQDPIAELLYLDEGAELKADPELAKYLADLQNLDATAYQRLLVQRYFEGYFSKYNVQAYVFLGDSLLNPGSATDPRKNHTAYFDDLIRRYGQPTMARDLSYIDNFKEKEIYVLRLKTPPSNVGRDTLDRNVYIALESRILPEKIGFPDLFLDKEDQDQLILTGYSFAKYKSKQLTYQYGNFPFPLNPNMFGPVGPPHSEFIELEGFNHLVLRVNPNLLVVLSQPIEDLLARATTFSYLFAFFSILVLVVLVLRNIRSGWHFTRLSFNSKVQLLLVAVILVSLILFGLGTSYYINRQYTEKNLKNISEKIQSVQIEVDNKLGNYGSLAEADPNYKLRILTKFSKVFFTDITLYDPNGNMDATSRPKLFNEGLAGKKMDARAYHALRFQQKSEFIHEEHVGKMRYLSAYVPFKNNEGELLAYLNLPYFAKQSELENEISSYLVALINIYVLLFALSVVAALLISNIITQPLRLVQKMLGQVELGKTNEAIAYEGKDEIGALVKVYNSKVAELQVSAELLARSERESAWREMAKQVAHEIKNPLTPMKLSVQHLQRSWKDKPDQFEDRLNRVSATLIEQIDTLSSIANEFSNFAKMPRAHAEEVNIRQVLESIMELFSEVPDHQFRFSAEDEDVIVFADKEQLLRAFNNLVKNANQAIPEGEEGIIEVILTTSEETVMVEVKDNGTGISDDKVDKIFVPNFTTKTGGMGLGLAMVKNIVENARGKVWFKTKLGKGTSFYVQLPVHTTQDQN